MKTARRIQGGRFPRLIDAFHSTWARCVVLIFAGVATHLPALQGERIWDDEYLSKGSPLIKSPLFILESFRHYLFLDSSSRYYRPVQNVSYIIDYLFWNNDTIGFHLTNILLHTTAGVLLYFLLRRLFQSLLTVTNLELIGRRTVATAAFLVALIWMVHPVHSAAIDYISGRADSLAFLFACAGWLTFQRAQNSGRLGIRISLYFLAAIFGLAALFSREIACVWLVLFCAYLLSIEKGRPFAPRMTAVVCCVILFSIYFACRQLPAARPPATSDAMIGQGEVRAVLMLRALGDYGRLLLFPANLHMERRVLDPIAYRTQLDWRQDIGFEYLSILGLLVLAGFIFGSIKPGPGQTMRIFGAGWFFAAYLPISNIVPLTATAAEHWLYLPSVGFLIFAGGWAIDLPRQHWRIALVIAVLATSAFGVRCYVRSTDWISAETFYRRTIASGGASPRCALNLGQLYASRGDYAEAVRIFRKLLDIVPDYSLAQNNLGSALSNEGKTREAEALFASLEKNSEELRHDYPRSWIGALNLAGVRYSRGDHDSAIAILERARRNYPEVWELVSLESEFIRQTDGPDASLHLVEQFARKNWWHYSAQLALGRLYAQKGDVDLARAAWQRASRLDVHDIESLRLAVIMELREKNFEEARRTQLRAIRRQPDQPRQYALLSEILTKMGRADEAHVALARAAELRAFALAN